MPFQTDQCDDPNRSSESEEDEGHDRLRNLREDSFSGNESEDACIFAETQNGLLDELSPGSESDEESEPLASSYDQRSKEKPTFGFLSRMGIAFLMFPIIMTMTGLSTTSVGPLPQAQEPAHLALQSNGSHNFGNTVILVSFDGFKPAYLNRGMTPHLTEVAGKGVRAQYLRSIFPTLTFPNHWSIQTGLYAESHGIVGNDFHDPTDNTKFYFTGDDTSVNPKWWFGEPMWETAVKNGLKSASIMWPGPPVMMSGIRPTYHVPFLFGAPWDSKVDQIAAWLDMPDALRPNLICAYLPEIDQTGHRYGPDSDEINYTLGEMDQFSQALHYVLAERNLIDIANVIYVSDHGMAETANERVLLLEDILGEDGMAAIESKEGWPFVGLKFKDGTDEEVMAQLIRKSIEDSNGGYAYYTPETMPAHYHFSGTPRIAPHFLVPEYGWAIGEKSERWYKDGTRYDPIGAHGYDRDHSDMHAIFIAQGPFAERIKSTQREKISKVFNLPSSDEDIVTVMPGFDNLELYNLVTRHMLELPVVAPNNGTDGFWESLTQ